MDQIHLIYGVLFEGQVKAFVQYNVGRQTT